MAIDTTVWQADAAAIIADFPSTMTWVNPSGATESIPCQMSPVRRSGEFTLEGVYPEYEAEIMTKLGAYASSSVLPVAHDEVSVNDITYFIVSRNAGPAVVMLKVALRNG